MNAMQMPSRKRAIGKIHPHTITRSIDSICAGEHSITQIARTIEQTRNELNGMNFVHRPVATSDVKLGRLHCGRTDGTSEIGGSDRGIEKIRCVIIGSHSKKHPMAH